MPNKTEMTDSSDSSNDFPSSPELPDLNESSQDFVNTESEDWQSNEDGFNKDNLKTDQTDSDSTDNSIFGTPGNSANIEPSPIIDPFPYSDDAVASDLSANADDRGEWDQLSGKVSDWFSQNDFASQWNRLRQPLLIGGVVIVALLALQVYGNILGAIASVPAAPRLFQLFGVVWILLFSVKNLVRSGDRKEFSSGLVTRWKKFIEDVDSNT